MLANIVISALLFLLYYSLLRYCDNCSDEVIFGANLLDLLYLAPVNLPLVRIKETVLRFRQSREEVKMKTLSLAAFIGCILAIGLAIQFDEIEDVEQFNNNLKEAEDLPFLGKDKG